MTERAAKIAEFEKSSGDFYKVLEELDAWSEQILKEDAEEIGEMRNEIEVAETLLFSRLGQPVLFSSEFVCLSAFLIHKSFLMPIQRMASAAKEAIEERNPSLAVLSLRLPGRARQLILRKKFIA